MSRGKRKKPESRRYVYLIGHYLDLAPSTHINHTDSDPVRELERHNDVRGGGLRETKRAVGHWRLLLFMYVPAERRIDTRALVERWRAACRTVYHRLMWGIESAARMMLLCHINDEPLRTSEARAKLPKRKLDKVLDRMRAAGAGEPLSDTYVQRCVERYLAAPAAVYLARLGADAAADPVAGELEQRSEPAPLSHRFLDRINTLPPTKRAHTDAGVCLTQPPPDAPARPLARSTSALVAPPTKGAAAAARSSSRLARDLAAVQQSEAFRSAAQRVDDDAIEALAAHAAQPLRRRLARDGALMRRFGDALCVDMHDESTLRNMEAISGAADHRCVCGMHRSRDQRPAPVVLVPGEAPTQAYTCLACGRVSVAYERHCISAPRFDDRLRPLAAKANCTPLPPFSPRTRTKLAANADDSQDTTIRNLLLVTFSDAAYRRGAEAPAHRPRTPRKLVPADDSGAPLEYEHAPSLGAHASLAKLGAPAAENDVIVSMFAPIECQ